jgi:hypothetical protein
LTAPKVLSWYLISLFTFPANSVLSSYLRCRQRETRR